ncbi:hypothetical protein B0H16DRAFT_1718200 [Mycena metata]|uniref:Uncharacterized protein n=1 Tax=Mycena metata TaxID=1033252 RepID=A0AAD7NKJ3_9AGAR|nr:hypothetical protein B0H16DRAFT_1718200 [Mycena metata]
MTIPRLPTLSRPQCVALLTTLDLGDRLTVLNISANCNFGLTELLVFLRHHRNLAKVTLNSGAISAPAVALDPQLQPHSGRIRILDAPAAYLPLILPYLAHSVADLNISSTTNPIELTRAFASHRDVEAAEAPLRKITRLLLYAQFNYRATDAQRISRWLTRFPDLLTLELHCRTSVPVLAQADLAELMARDRTWRWNGVHFRSYG